MRKLILLCVVYNKKCDDAETIKSFFNNDYYLFNSNGIKIELHVWDNSTKKIVREYNSSFCNENEVYYHSNGKNEFLSVVYNKFLYDYKDDFILIFDDDSNVSNDYMKEVVTSVEKVDFHVGVPNILSQLGHIYSPARFGLVKGQHIKETSSGFHSSLVAISSGMVINASKIVSEDISFDEKLNLYGIDTDFCMSLARKNIPLYVFDVSVSHDLSCFNLESSQIKRKRFLNLMKSNLYISRKRSNIHFLLFLLYVPLVFIKNIKLFITNNQ